MGHIFSDICQTKKNRNSNQLPASTSTQVISNQINPNIGYPYQDNLNNQNYNQVYNSYHSNDNNYSYTANNSNPYPELQSSKPTNGTDNLTNEKKQLDEKQIQQESTAGKIIQQKNEIPQTNINTIRNEGDNLTIQNLKDQVKELQSQLNNNLNLIKQKDNEIGQLKKNVSENEKEKTILKNEKDKFMNETKNLNAQINGLQNQLNNNGNIIMQKDNEIVQLKQYVSANELEKTILKNEKDTFMNETKNLKEQINGLRNQLNNNGTTIMQKNNELELLKKKVNEYEKTQIILKNKETEKITNLNNIIMQNKAQYDKDKLEYETKIRKYKEENIQIKNQKEGIISTFKNEKNNLVTKLGKLKEENALLKMSKEPILVGLNNIGATCYMNATLQCLSNTTKLTEYFLKMFNYEINNKNRLMSNEYYNVVKNLWDYKNNNKSFSPDSFKEKLSQENPLFKGIQANDSKDLINFLLERFHLELNEPGNGQNNNMMNNYEITLNDQLNEGKMLNIFINEFKTKYNSIISNLFYGMFETRSQCQKCRNIKYNFQVYSFLEFPLEQVNKYCFNHGKRQNYNSNNQNPDVDLYECFEYNCNLDLMAGDNQMYCNICNSTQDALYGTQIYSAPNYLIINLNRGRGAVYECKVIFPEKLNLLNFITFKNENTFYELYAVICHLGPSSMSGHFVAYCKKKKDEHYKWYLFNDAIVTECQKQEEFRNGMPYILFYKAL